MSEDYEIDPCIVCTEENAKTIPPNFDGIHQECPRCGEFKFSRTALPISVRGLGKENRVKLSGWIFAQNRQGEVPMITTANFENILAHPIPSVIERATNLLQEAERGLKHLGDTFTLNEPRFLSATYSSDNNDVDYLFKLLSEQDLVEYVSMGIYGIRPNGYIKLEELKQKISKTSKGFVAMWFHQDLELIYSDGFQVGILEAGYNPVRMDRLEHVNRIDDEIIRQVKSSKFVVADFTGHRGGVYFEAGFALGHNLPVFWTCRKDNLNESHFDIRQFNCIDWETPVELAERLAARLEAVLGPGPNKPL